MPDPTQPPSRKPAQAAAGAARIALVYAGLSALWILLSDRAVQAIAPDARWMTGLSILKGWAFVGVTATLLFVMVRRLVLDLASREDELRALLQAIPDLIWLKDPAGVYLACNPAFERFFGAKEAAIVGRTDHDFVPRELADFFRQKDREALEAGGPRVNEEWITLAATGERILLETLKTPMLGRNGRVLGVLGIGRDITEQSGHAQEKARLQAQLFEAQKLESLGRLAGGVAHDHNNMLGVILANADLALYHLGEGRPERKYLEEIVKAARHSADLTHQMLAFARRQPADLREADLNRCVADLLGVLGRLAGEGIELDWKPGRNLWPVQVDSTQLERVLTNLVVNARDAIAGPGRIEIETANRHLPEGEGAWDGAESGDYVALRVSDTGCGMSPDLVANIFEPFFTTKPTGRGTGLGLAMVHGIVKQHRGVLRVETEPGQGSTFHILLPRAATGAGALADPA